MFPILYQIKEENRNTSFIFKAGDFLQKDLLIIFFKRLTENILIENVSGLKNIFGNEYQQYAEEQIAMIKEISGHIAGINTKVDAMVEARKKANNMTDIEAMAAEYCDVVKPFFEEIRYHADKLELLVDDEIWTLTKYRELLFTK